MNQIPQVDFHIPNRILLFLNLLSQFFQVNFVLQKGFGILLVQLLKRFQIDSGLLVLLGAFLVFAHDGSLCRHLIFQLHNISGQRRGVFLYDFLFLAQIQDYALYFAAHFVILLCQLRHFAAMVAGVYRLVHLIQQLLRGLRYAGAAAPAATAALAATASARAFLAAAAALQGITAGIAKHILIGVDPRARPYARERIPLRALLWHRDGFHRPLAGGDQRIDGVRRQILHADQPTGQCGKVRDRGTSNRDKRRFVQTTESIFALHERRRQHGANLIPVGQQDLRVDVPKIFCQRIDLTGSNLRARRHLLGRRLIFLIGFDGSFRFFIVSAKCVADADRAVLQLFDGLGGIFEILRGRGFLRRVQFAAQRGHLLFCRLAGIRKCIFALRQFADAFLQRLRRLIGVVQRDHQRGIGFGDGLLERFIKSVPYFHGCQHAFRAALAKGTQQLADLIIVAVRFGCIRGTFPAQLFRHVG